MEVDPQIRNVLLTHQFVTGAARCESEELSVGGTDNVDASVFDGFDYVALGHIHGPQQVGRATIRYCGTPLKYSFSEARQQKSVTVVELGPKGSVEIRTLPLTPLRDMAELRGSYQELSFRGFYEGTDYPNSYVHITLTDEDDIPDAVSKLRILYPYLMKLDYDNQRTRAGQVTEGAEDVHHKTPLQLLEEFYEKQNAQPMSEAQRAFAQGLIEQIWEDEA
jgi:exonuclease SbcD